MWKFLKRFWAIGFIFVIWFIFAHPYFLKGKVPYSSTFQVNQYAPWSAYEKFWGPVKNGAMPDVTTQIYPWRHLAIEIWKSGQVPLWNPYSFSGTPLLANYQSAVLSPFNLLFFVLPFVDGWSILVLLQPLMASLFMYLFVRSLRVSRVGSLISSISFMFCGFITVWMGYATLGYAILFLPLALFCIEKYYKTQEIRFLILLSLSIPLSFFSGHFQISIYFLITISVYILYKFFTIKNILNTVYLILYTFYGLLLCMPQLLPSIEFYTQSFRSSFFQKGTIPWEYVPTFLAPDFFGNPVTRNDWFEYYAERNAYIGVLPFMLAVYSFLRIKKPQTLFLFFFGIFTLILATNNPISNFILDRHIPVLSTSVIGRIIVLYSFAFAVLAGFGFDRLVLDIKNRNKRTILIWLSLFGIFFLILWVMVFQRLFMPIDKTVVARQNLILPTFLFFSSCLIIIFGVISWKHKYSYLILCIVPFMLLFLVAFDMLRFATKWQAFDPKELVFPETPTTSAFSKIAGFHRVLGNFGAEVSAYYHLPSVEGYDALYIKRYGEFVSFINNGEIIKSAWSVVDFPKNGTYTKKAVNMLDVRYVAHKLADDRYPWAFPFWTYPKDQFKIIYKDAKYEFYENTKTIPHAFLVGKYRVAQNPRQILSIIFNKSFDLRKEIVLEKEPEIKKAEGNIGTVSIDKYSPNAINMVVDAKRQGLLFVSDSYHDGWKADVDGISVPIYRSNYTFRAVPVKEGKHLVRLTYDPISFRLGVALSVVALIGVLITSLAPRFLNRLILILPWRNERDR